MDTVTETQEQGKQVEPPVQESLMIALRDISQGKAPCRSLTPDFRAADIRDIDFNLLHALGINHVYLDVDNTLTETNGAEIDQERLAFLQEQQKAGLIPHIHLATDSTRDLSGVAEPLGAERIPTPRILRKQSFTYWNKLATQHPPQESVMIGDSPVWDMRGANSVGMVTIMVEPFSPYATLERAVLKPWMDGKARAKIDEHYGEKCQPPLR